MKTSRKETLQHVRQGERKIPLCLTLQVPLRKFSQKLPKPDNGLTCFVPASQTTVAPFCTLRLVHT